MQISLILDNYCTNNCWYCCDNVRHIRGNDSIIDTLGEEAYLKLVLNLAGDLKVNYRINGGEPFQNIHIKKVTERILSEGHNITFLSNLVHIDNVYDVCIKEKIQIEASFHLGQYKQDMIDRYLREYFVKACEIANSITVIIVMTPDVIKNERLQEYIDILKNTGREKECKVSIVFQELYNDKYPSAYTEEEREFLRGVSPDIDYLIKANRILYLKGMDCSYMKGNIDVHRNGTISRCSSGVPAYKEDLHKTSLSVSEGTAPCHYDKCLCIPRGIKGCLELNNLTLKEYCNNLSL